MYRMYISLMDVKQPTAGAGRQDRCLSTLSCLPHIRMCAAVKRLRLLIHFRCNFVPAQHLIVDERLERSGSRRRHEDAERPKPLLNLGLVERAIERCIQLVDDGGRRPGWRGEPVPGALLETGQIKALLGEGRNVLRHFEALLT